MVAEPFFISPRAHRSFRVSDSHPVSRRAPSKVVLSQRRWEITMAFGNHSAAGTQRPARLGIALGTALGCAWLRLRAWIDRRRQRHALAELDDRLLRDIGVSRQAARRELDKWFWQP
jgi:uncharacterized protein YjiS (DUF1127 family)